MDVLDGLSGKTKDMTSKEVALTDKDIKCLEFAINSSKEFGLEANVGIKCTEFDKADFKVAQYDNLVGAGYFSRMLIMFDRNHNNLCNLAGEQGTKNVGGVYLAVTRAGVEFYKTLSKILV